MNVVRQLGAVTLAAAAGMILVLSVPPAASSDTMYYVNFDRGSDSADGLSLASPWRHAPGDPNAEGVAARTSLGPGDTLLFVGGVHYRGHIKLNGSGAEGRPVVLTSVPGGPPAIIDGSDVTGVVRKCSSKEDCGGSPIWQKLVRIDFPTSLSADPALFVASGPLYLAESPAPTNQLNADDTSTFLQGPTDNLQHGEAPLPPDLVRTLASPGDKEIILELYANEVAIRPITGVQGNVALFDPSGLHFNKDRPVHFALLAHPLFVRRPGEYALLAGNSSAVALLPSGADDTVSQGDGRGGVDLNSQSNVEIRNLVFEDMAATGSDWAGGIAIVKNASGSNISITHNVFKYFHLPTGAGPIAVNFTNNLKIDSNLFETVVFGSGMRLYKDSLVEIKGNTIEQIGRTGVMLIDVLGAVVAENKVVGAQGIHGNGMSAYIDNRGVVFEANIVRDATRPITIHGSQDGFRNDITLSRNVLIGTPDSDAAITSWGDIHGIKILHNVLLGGKTGATLSQSDTDVVMADNSYTSDLVVKHNPYMRPGGAGYVPGSWTVTGGNIVSLDKGRSNAICDLPQVREDDDVADSKFLIGALGCSQINQSR